MINNKQKKITALLSILIVVISVIGLAYVSAEIEIITDTDIEDGFINLVTAEAVAFNNNTGTVNFSQFAEIWLTNEGQMDNVPDLYPTFIADGFNSTIDIHDQNLNTTSNVRFGNLTILNNLSVDGNTLFVDDVNNRVGIGTINPSAPLHIKGVNVDNRNLILQDDSGNRNAIEFQNDTGDATWIIDAQEGGIRIAEDDTGLVNVRFQIDSGGNVGIGETNPDQKLQVAGGHVKVDSGFSFLWGDSFERIEGDNTVGKIKFFTNNGEQMTLEGGNLGIGTTSPSHKLNVIGDANITGNLFGNGSELDIFLNDLGDVDTTGVATGDFLQKSAGDWVDFDLFAAANTWSDTQDFSSLDIGPYEFTHTAFNGFTNLLITEPTATTADLTLRGTSGDFDLTVEGNIETAQRYGHVGDGNTYWELTTDKIAGIAGGDEFLVYVESPFSSTFELSLDTISYIMMTAIGLSPGTTIFNDAAANVDHRFKGDTDTELLFLDASTDRVGISTPTPDTLFQVAGSTHIDDNLTLDGSFNWASFLSVTTTADSTKVSTEFNMFDEDNYASFDYVNNSEPNGINFVPSTGQFTIEKTGIYTFAITPIFEISGNNVILYIIKEDGSDIYNHRILVHAGVDPAMNSLTQVRRIQAGSNLTFHGDSLSADTLGANDGTTFSIWRIS